MNAVWFAAMSEAPIAVELERLLGGLYYSEDFEVVSLVRHFHDQLPAARKLELRGEIRRRILSTASLLDVYLCVAVPVPECAFLLADLLDQQEAASQFSRTLMEALRVAGVADVFPSVVRFLDSDQEREALATLAALDFPQALPHVAARMEHREFADSILHIFADRKRRVGLEKLAAELRAESAAVSPLRGSLNGVLHAKSGKFNPFTTAEVAALLQAVGNA